MGRISVPGSPLRYHGTAQTPAVPSPALGEDTEAVLGELLGLSAAEVAELRAAGAV
jgi:2-methylfumaryl-CoA isomerase